MRRNRLRSVQFLKKCRDELWGDPDVPTEENLLQCVCTSRGEVDAMNPNRDAGGTVKSPLLVNLATESPRRTEKYRFSER